MYLKYNEETNTLFMINVEFEQHGIIHEGDRVSILYHGDCVVENIVVNSITDDRMYVKNSDDDIIMISYSDIDFIRVLKPCDKSAGVDMVNHPSHYKSESGLEVIDVIKAFTADLKGYQATDTGNIIKYILRWPHKNGLEDLKKAQWYLSDLINTIEEDKKQKGEEK